MYLEKKFIFSFLNRYMRLKEMNYKENLKYRSLLRHYQIKTVSKLCINYDFCENKSQYYQTIPLFIDMIYHKTTKFITKLTILI